MCRTNSTMTLLTKLVKSKNKFFTAQIIDTIKQSGSSDCGVFAAAYATSLAFGHDPCAFVYHQCRMREHLLRCLQQKKMEPFEFSIHKNGENTHSSVQSVNVYCFCRCQDSWNAMVCCDGNSCGEWFHIEYFDAAVKKEAKWYCKKCDPTSTKLTNVHWL